LVFGFLSKLSLSGRRELRETVCFSRDFGSWAVLWGGSWLLALEDELEWDTDFDPFNLRLREDERSREPLRSFSELGPVVRAVDAQVLELRGK